MKLQELGLKNKPMTHYFDHGYVKFKTESKTLFYKIVLLTDDKNMVLFSNYDVVKDSEHLKALLSIKSRSEVVA